MTYKSRAVFVIAYMDTYKLIAIRYLEADLTGRETGNPLSLYSKKIIQDDGLSAHASTYILFGLTSKVK